MSEIRGVIFDVYETLALNSASLWIETLNDICRDQGLPLDGNELWSRWRLLDIKFREERYTPSYPFKSYQQSWEECFCKVFNELGKGDAGSAAYACITALGNRNLYPEVKSVIRKLRNMDEIRVGILSNSDNGSLWPLLNMHNLEFDAVVSSQSAQIYKPTSEIFHLIASAIGVQERLCLFVGDSQHDDILGASNVGMYTALVNRSGKALDPVLPSPDYEIRGLNELLYILE